MASKNGMLTLNINARSGKLRRAKSRNVVEDVDESRYCALDGRESQH